MITAFLDGLLTDDIYMIIPQGFPQAGQVCKLNQALHGLKHAFRAWYTCINSYLQNLGLKRSSKDPNLYFSIKNNLYTILLLYVDDIILTSNDTHTINHIKRTLMSTFKMTDLKDAKYYLGIKLTHTKEGIYFHQRGYIEKLLDRFDMSNCVPVAVPMNLRLKLQK